MKVANGKFEIRGRQRAILLGLVLVLTLVPAGMGYGQMPDLMVPRPDAPYPQPMATPNPQASTDSPVAPLLWKIDPLGLGADGADAVLDERRQKWRAADRQSVAGRWAHRGAGLGGRRGIRGGRATRHEPPV